MEFVIAAVAVVLYFVPLLVATTRNHVNMLAIGVLNLLLGWTLIGWVAALVWACTAQKPKDP